MDFAVFYSFLLCHHHFFSSVVVPHNCHKSCNVLKPATRNLILKLQMRLKSSAFGLPRECYLGFFDQTHSKASNAPLMTPALCCQPQFSTSPYSHLWFLTLSLFLQTYLPISVFQANLNSFPFSLANSFCCLTSAKDPRPKCPLSHPDSKNKKSPLPTCYTVRKISHFVFCSFWEKAIDVKMTESRDGVYVLLFSWSGITKTEQQKIYMYIPWRSNV